MKAEMIIRQARALYDAHGVRAEAEAAQNAKRHEAAGEKREAEDWHAIRAAIREMRGPHQG